MAGTKATRDTASDTTPLLFFLVVLLLGAGIGLPLGVRLGYLSPNVAPAPAAGPTRVASPAPAITMMRAASQNYQQLEGAHRRGPFFEQLVYSLNQLPAPGPARFSRTEILQMLGAPDLMSTDRTAGTTSLLYYYTQIQPRDRCVIVTIGAADRVVTIGMTDASLITLSQWAPYPQTATATPTTEPVEETEH